MLYVNPVFGRYVEEKGSSDPMEPAQSDALLQYLYAQADHPEYCFSFVYEPGSMAQSTARESATIAYRTAAELETIDLCT